MTSTEPPGKKNSGGQSDTLAISKPGTFDLEKFKAKRDPTIGGVETLLTALPHHSLVQAKDYVRLHPNTETHWSSEFCFVHVPVKGMKRDNLHLIDEEIALRNLPSGGILRFRLALASKPHDVFFLCHVPTQNLDNSWNYTNALGCDAAMTQWVQLTSRSPISSTKPAVATTTCAPATFRCRCAWSRRARRAPRARAHRPHVAR